MTETNTGQKLFRKEAQERLVSPEQLDQRMRITSSAGWIALLALGLLLVCAILWGVYGSIPTKVAGSGILMQRGGMFTVSARASGRIQSIRFKAGDQVSAGEVVAVIGQPGIRDQILAAEDNVRELKTRYEQQQAFGKQDIELEEKSLSEKRLALRQNNEALKDQLKLLQERLKDQRRLVKMGLITSIKALNTQIEIDNRNKEIRQNNDQIKQLSIQKLQTRNRIQENLLVLKTKLKSATDNLQTLQNTLEEDSRAISFYSGRIISVDVALGDVAQPGTDLMTVEMTGQNSRFLEAVLYFPATQGKRIQQGMTAHVSPSTVKRDQFGSIIGLVTSVSEFPASPKTMKRVLQNEDMVKDLSKAGPPIEVRVALVPDSRTFSWYLWTSSKGPPVAIHAGTMCTASAIVKRQPPIQLVVPLMKKYVLGIGSGQTDKGF